jgi:uncharacterized membrane protein YdfJ with MMPL/SSD domain
MAEETQGEKTFTQSELNAIIADRLSKVTEKYADYDDLKTKAQKYDEAEEASKSELQKATEARDALQAELEGYKKADAIRQVRDKVATEKGLPANLLTAETEEECAAQADAILSFAQKPDYPTVKDGGEVINTGKKTTRDQFADWMNKQF